MSDPLAPLEALADTWESEGLHESEELIELRSTIAETRASMVRTLLDPDPEPLEDGSPMQLSLEQGELALILHKQRCRRCAMGWYCGGIDEFDEEDASEIISSGWRKV